MVRFVFLFLLILPVFSCSTPSADNRDEELIELLEKSEIFKNYDPGRFMLVDIGDRPFVIDTSTGTVWVFEIGGDNWSFNKTNFENKYSSAMEAIQANKKDPLGILK